VFNQLNTSLVGGQSISMIFRVHGSWAGEIFGAPQDLVWMENGNGGIYLFDTEGGTGNDTVHVNATNTASINNNVHVVALTGENAISGSETALISTGNAYAGANIMNIANATVIGRNWIMAIVNIFGDFNGNIAFGRPDLWIGGQVSVPKKIQNGSELEYTLTIINNGDSIASDVILEDEYDTENLEIFSASLGYTTDESGKLLWELPDLKPGEATEITYQARVLDADYNTDITNTLMVNAHETDNNVSDNTDIVTITTSSRPSRGGSSRVRILPASTTLAYGGSTAEAIMVTRVSSTTNVHIGEGDTVTQSLIVENTTGATLSNIVLRDLLHDPSGAVLHEEIWDLGDVLPHELIEISYDVQFGSNAPLGLYALESSVEMGGSLLTKERNGTVLLWGQMLTELTFIAPTVLGTSTEQYAPTIIERIMPKMALAAEGVDVRNSRDIGLSRVFAMTGTLLFLMGLLGLYQWFRPERIKIIQRK
jgi:hypothetical protein